MIDVDLVGEFQIICLATLPSRKWGISPLFKLTFLQRVQYGKGNTIVEKRDKLPQYQVIKVNINNGKSC